MGYKMTDSPVLIKELFIFLQNDYKFALIQETSSNSGILFIYQNEYCKVGISFDYRDNNLEVELVRGKNTQYPSDIEFGKNIKPLYELVQKHDSLYDIRKLQADNNQFYEALKNNAEILKKYGKNILIGKEWI